MNMLTLSHVSKSFGQNKIIDDLNISVPQHTIYGFIGQNGAGKTTTMKMILGLLSTDSGKIMVNGEPVKYGQNKTNKHIGYLPDVPEFYGFMTPVEYLCLCGNITGMAADKIPGRVAEMLELVGLESSEKKRIQGFSRGMKQRLGIAQALLNSPELLICDEPTSALDPLGRKEILDILATVKEYTTVIFSTHILTDVEKICDEIAFLHNGSIALSGSLEEIRQLHPSTGFEIEFLSGRDAGLFSSKFDEGKPLSITELLYEHKKEIDMIKAMKILTENNISIQKIEMVKPTLEDMFMEVIGK